MKKRMFEVFSEQTNFPVAKDYERRAKKIIRHFLDMLHPSVEMMGGKFKEPTPQMMDAFVDELPGILNWVADGAHKNSIAAKTYSNLPLTEEQMLEVEARIRGAKVITIEDDITKRKFCGYMRQGSNQITIFTDKKEILDITVVK